MNWLIMLFIYIASFLLIFTNGNMAHIHIVHIFKCQIGRIILFLLTILAQLHKNLQHYDTLHASDLSHKLVKRGAKPSTNPFNTIKEVEFQTLGRNFRLILHPQKDVLHSKFKAYTVDGNGNETIVHVGKSMFFFCIRERILYFLRTHRSRYYLQWSSIWGNKIICSSTH